MPAPPAKQRETAHLSRRYRQLLAEEHAEAIEAAPILARLQARLAGTPTTSSSSMVSFLSAYASMLAVDARTVGTALRMIADWWGSLSDPLFDEPEDFWLWARRLLTTRRTVRMSISLTIAGESLADIHRQCMQIAAEGMKGVETVPGRALEVYAEANTRSPVEPPANPTNAPAASSPSGGAGTAPIGGSAAAPTPPPSIDDVRKAAAEAVKVKGKDGVLAIFAKYGAAQIPQLPAPKYAEVIAALQAA